MKSLILSILSLLIATTLYAQENTVRFALWGGNETINAWVDGYVTDTLKERHGISLVRVPLSDTQDAIQKLIRDKRMGRENGSIDLLWLNGENFKAMKDNALTWKPFLNDLENAQYINLNDPTIANDFGIKHQGHEAPWGSAQMVFIYDSAKIKSPPKNLADLVRWIKQNPGKFTYSAPPDFTGSAFIRQTMMNILGEEGYAALAKNVTTKKLKGQLPKLWSLLNEIEPSLYRNGTYYPETISKLHQHFSDGTLWITMDYYPSTAQRMIDKGIFPETTKTFILNEGSLANTHYLTIPFNARQKDAAKTTINFLLGIDAQASKLKPRNWGDFSVLDLNRLSQEDADRLQSIDLGDATLDLDILNDAKRQEIPAQYIPMIEEEWKKNIIQN